MILLGDMGHMRGRRLPNKTGSGEKLNIKEKFRHKIGLLVCASSVVNIYVKQLENYCVCVCLSKKLNGNYS